MNFFENYYDEISRKLSVADFINLGEISKLILNAKISRKKVIVVGNGGSAAMASHVSVDLTKAAKIRAVNFNEADLITCFANDYGYENWITNALEAYADKGDVLVVISSSGQSKNILNAAITAKSLGLSVVTLSGFKPDNPLRNLGDYNLYVNSSNYNYVEMIHHIWLLSIVDHLIEKS
jgi:D-sedoheptulose 7-phosphate isomerase